MDFQQKACALAALSPHTGGFAIYLRNRGDWYATCKGVEVGNGKFLSGTCSSGKTPEEAVDDLWRQLTDIGESWLVINAMSPKRYAVRWNGFMWEPFKESSHEVR